MKNILIGLLQVVILLFVSSASCKKNTDGPRPPLPPVPPPVNGNYDYNFAKNGQVWVSSEESPNAKLFLVDGKTYRTINGNTYDQTFYSSTNASPYRDVDHEEWIVIKFSQLRDINEIRLFPVGFESHEGFPIDFKIQVSEDNSTWVTVADVKDHPLPETAEPQIFTFNTTKALYIKVVATRLRPISNQWTNYSDVYLLRLSEVEAYLSSAKINAVILDQNFIPAGDATNLNVDVSLSHVMDNTDFDIELVNGQGNSLPAPVKKTATAKSNGFSTVLNIPGNLTPGDYKIKVTGPVDGDILPALSGVLKIASKGNRTFYVSNSDGNDGNDGLTQASALKTLTKASQLNLLPGDKLLLKKGDLWQNESLLPKGSGTKEAPIIISSYGSSTSRPHIKPNYQTYYGIRIVNAAGYEISGIEVSNVLGGIVVWEENTYNHKYLKIKDCYLHDMTDVGRAVPTSVPDLLYGMGISIAGSDNYGGKTLLSDIYVEDCEIDLCDVGIEVIGRDHDPTGAWLIHHHNKISRFAFTNFNIKDCNITRSYRTGGVVLNCITGGVSENILIDLTGYNGIGMYWGVCAFQVARVSDYLVQNCTFSNTIKGTSPDGQGFDWEGDNHNVVVKNCRFINNEGPATLNHMNGSWAGSNTGCVLDGCYLYKNNSVTLAADPTYEYYNRVFGISLGTPDNSGIFKNCEIHLRSNGQDYSSFPLVFDESNRVYDTDGNLIYSGVDRSNPIFTDAFSNNLSAWNNASYGSISNGKLTIQNNNLLYIKNPFTLSNFYTEADFDFSGEGAAGIAFGVSDYNNYYIAQAEVRLSMMSNIVIYKVVNGVRSNKASIYAHGLKPNMLFRMRVTVSGKKISVYGLGSLLGTYEADESITGTTGLYQGNVICKMDNFLVHPL